MDKEGKDKNGGDFVLQWGSTKRLRCVKMKNKEQDHKNQSTKAADNGNIASSSDSLLGNKKSTSIVDLRAVDKGTASPASHRATKNLYSPNNKRKTSAASPEKEDRYPYYATRGSVALEENGNGRLFKDHCNENGVPVLPRLNQSLSTREKEEDFMAMKGCRLPHRPRKRPKSIQRAVHLVCPGTWLSDISQERYEVREKKTSRKRPRGLKAMIGMESDSE